MENQFARTELLLGTESTGILAGARVAVFGVGGVGGYVVEALARAGVGALDLVDDDKVSVNKLNRQIIATWDTVGQYKVDVAKARVLSIHPGACVRTHKTFFTPQTAELFDFTQYDYVVDAIDTVTGKLTLAERAFRAGVPIISSMGTGNKLDPAAFVVTDISRTTMCPLARIMRKELKKRGIHHMKVVYSTEEAMEPVPELEEALLVREREETDPDRGTSARRQIPGSMPFVPPVAGFIVAGEVIRDLLKQGQQAGQTEGN